MTEDRPHIIVSGGTRGLGKVLVGGLLERGYSVSTFSRNPGTSLEESKQHSLLVEQADIAEPGSLERFLGCATARFGPAFGLINNAGIAADGVLATMRPDRIHDLLSVNLEGTLLLSRAVIRRMLTANRGGAIINISSITGLRGYSGLSVYAATKAGLDGMTRALARELGPRRIRVNSIAPGYLETDMTTELAPDQRAAIIRRTPLARLGTAEDIVGAVVFLLSPAAAFITGQILAIDGGLTC